MIAILHFLYRILRFRVTIDGAEHLPTSGPFIIAGNHESYFDPGAVKIALFATRKQEAFFLTKEAIARTWKKFLGSNAYQVLGMLPIDSSDKSKVLTSAQAHLANGGVVGIFPEGTRNKPSLNPDWQQTFLRAKTGAARLAFTTGVPVVPVAITAPAGIGIMQTIVNVLAFWKPTRLTFLPMITTTLTQYPTKEQLEGWTTNLMTTIASARGKRYPA